VRIAIDIGHPAHVHYFRHLIHDLRAAGHQFLVTARERGEVFALLEAFDIPYVSRGAGASGALGKLLNLPRANLHVYRAARAFRPHLFVSFASMYAAQVAAVLRIPHIAFDDTEFVRAGQMLYRPFSEVVLTPWCFREDFGRQHLRFRGFVEMAYLAPERFAPSADTRTELGLSPDEPYALVRFNAFDAIHDRNITGFSDENRARLVRELGREVRVFVSAEEQLPSGMEAQRLSLPAHRIHDVMAHARLFVGESGTMATEAACLGTRAVRCDGFAGSALERGNFVELERTYGLLSSWNSDSQDEAIDQALALILDPQLEQRSMRRRERLLQETIDVAAFMSWFVAGYPGSAAAMRSDPDLTARRFARDASTAANDPQRDGAVPTGAAC